MKLEEWAPDTGYTGVAPFAGAWIEIECIEELRWLDIVAPFAGAWIEIFKTPSELQPPRVAPFAGAWIEMRILPKRGGSSEVAPFAGAWIEINPKRNEATPRASSLPSRERGLKLSCRW